MEAAVVRVIRNRKMRDVDFAVLSEDARGLLGFWVLRCTGDRLGTLHQYPELIPADKYVAADWSEVKYG